MSAYVCRGDFCRGLGHKEESDIKVDPPPQYLAVWLARCSHSKHVPQRSADWGGRGIPLTIHTLAIDAVLLIEEPSFISLGSARPSSVRQLAPRPGLRYVARSCASYWIVACQDVALVPVCRTLLGLGYRPMRHLDQAREVGATHLDSVLRSDQLRSLTQPASSARVALDSA
jgi:hypothetical protein